MSTQPDPPAGMPDLDGQRVQVPGEHQIWLVFGDRRHYITGIDVMRAIFRDDAFRTEADCARLPEGSPLGPGSRLVRGLGSPSVHLVVCPQPGQETRHLVVDADQFERYGFDPAKVAEIPTDALRSIPAGLPLGPLAAAAALAERQSLERLTESLNPDRPTLLLLLEERHGFAERFAAHLHEGARRRVNVLLGRIEDGRLVIASAPGEAGEALTARLELAALPSAARTLRIARIDLLATEFRPAARAAVTALGGPYDLTAQDEADVELRALARQADRVIACSEAVLAALRARLPGRTITPGLDPEAGKPNRFRVHPARLDPEEALRVLVWNGAPEPESGRASDLVAETVAADGDGLAVRFFGLDGHPAARPPAGLQALGPADRLDLNRLVCVMRPHLAWFPGPAPDAFDFRVSAALEQGLPILADAACGLGLRLADRPYTWILPADATAARVRAELAAIRTRWAAEYGRLHRTEAAPSFYPGAYLAWAAIDARPRAEPVLPPSDAAELAPAPLPPPAALPIPAKKRWRLFR